MLTWGLWFSEPGKGYTYANWADKFEETRAKVRLARRQIDFIRGVFDSKLGKCFRRPNVGKSPNNSENLYGFGLYAASLKLLYDKELLIGVGALLNYSAITSGRQVSGWNGSNKFRSVTWHYLLIHAISHHIHNTQGGRRILR